MFCGKEKYINLTISYLGKQAQNSLVFKFVAMTSEIYENIKIHYKIPPKLLI
jgi:hypothetical protein